MTGPPDGNAPGAGRRNGARKQPSNDTKRSAEAAGPQPNPRLEMAMALAAMGIAVVPIWRLLATGKKPECACSKLSKCPWPGKRPRFSFGTLEHGAHDATTNPDVIKDWWAKWPDANVGIAVGPRAGIVVMAIDSRRGGRS